MLYAILGHTRERVCSVVRFSPQAAARRSDVAMDCAVRDKLGASDVLPEPLPRSRANRASLAAPAASRRLRRSIVSFRPPSPSRYCTVVFKREDFWIHVLAFERGNRFDAEIPEADVCNCDAYLTGYHGTNKSRCAMEQERSPKV